MGKRASTNYSFVVGIDKPAGMSSHDVVNACRRIYGERRIGHTGTLDPDATGALAVCVGPATRLDRFLTGHDKTYEFSVCFGSATTTDDASGSVLRRADVPTCVCDEAFARKTVSNMVGAIQQLPPVYSAVKVAGKRAYAQARAGTIIDLAPRSVEVYAADLVSIDATDPAAPSWTIRTHVSSGTYVRSLARDLATSLGTVGHVSTLRRLSAGNVDIADCVSLDVLAADPFAYILDPVRLLGLRFLFATGNVAAQVASGTAISANSVELFAYDTRRVQESLCSCTSGVKRASQPLADGETLGIIVDNTLAALYSFDEQRQVLKSTCGFSLGVKRGGNL